MDFRIIPIKKREPNKYDFEKTFVIPVKIIQILHEKATGPIVPVIIERLDFFTGNLKNTRAITFKKSLNFFENLDIPFETEGIVYKEEGKIMFKIIGAYNAGFVEKIFNVQNHILDNDGEQIRDLYESNYKELRNWVGNSNSNEFDLIEHTL
jgi:hypothetical protein